MTLFEALEICLRVIKEEGLPPEVALARFPEYADDLRELIFVAGYLESVPPVTPSASFRLATREKIRKLKPPASNGHYAADPLNGIAKPNGMAKQTGIDKWDSVVMSGGSTKRQGSTTSFTPNPVPPRATVVPLPQRQATPDKQPHSQDKPLSEKSSVYGREAFINRQPIAEKGTLAEKAFATRAAVRQPETKQRRRGAWGPLWAAASAAAILLAVFAGTLFGTITSLPGSPLYSVKRASEWVRLNLAPNQGDRVLLLSGFANRRADEITALAGQTGQETLIRANQAVDEYNHTLQSITTQLPLPQTVTHQVAGDLSQQESKLAEQSDKLPLDRKEPVMQALDIVREIRSRLLGLPLRPNTSTTTPTPGDNTSQELPSRSGPVVLPGILAPVATITPARVSSLSPAVPSLTATSVSGGSPIVPSGALSTATPAATATDLPTATATPTVAPPSPTDTATVRPSATQTQPPAPTNTPVTANQPAPTNTPVPPATPVIMLTVVTATPTVVTPTVTKTSVPLRPSNTPTLRSTDTPAPTATPHVNHPPQINSVSCSPCNIFTQSSSTIRVSADDPDGDPLTFSWSAGPGSVSGGGSSANYNASFTFSPAGDSYPVSVNVTVSDGKGGSASSSVMVVVTQQ